MKKKMMAAVLYSPSDIRYNEVDIPVINNDEVLLKIKAAGNCGSDLHRIMVEGTYNFPCIPGHEFSGVIAMIGKDVKELKIGDRVTAAPLIQCMKCEWCLQGEYNLCEDYDYVGSRSNGAFAEYMKIQASNVVKIPDNVDFEDAAMTDPGAVALHAMTRFRSNRVGETITILGAGPIGMFACQWAKIMGYKKIIATDISKKKLDILDNIGVDVAINASSENVVERILEETDGKGASVIIETAGSIETHKQALSACRKRGRIIHIGRAYKDILIPDKIFTKIFRRELNIYGSVNSNFSPYNNEWEITVKYMSMGKLILKPIISHRLPISAIPETFKKMFNKEMDYNKIIFTP